MLPPLFAAAAVVTAADRAAVMAPIDGLFAALTARDGKAIQPLVWGKGGATVAVEHEDGTRSVRQTDFAGLADAITPGPEVEEERLIGSPILRIDGDLAMVWGRYIFSVDGKAHHCGVDHFQLARIEGAWKITSIAWTLRTTGCETPAPAPRTKKRKPLAQ